MYDRIPPRADDEKLKQARAAPWLAPAVVFVVVLAAALACLWLLPS